MKDKFLFCQNIHSLQEALLVGTVIYRAFSGTLYRNLKFTMSKRGHCHPSHQNLLFLLCHPCLSEWQVSTVLPTHPAALIRNLRVILNSHLSHVPYIQSPRPDHTTLYVRNSFIFLGIGSASTWQVVRKLRRAFRHKCFSDDRTLGAVQNWT